MVLLARCAILVLSATMCALFIQQQSNMSTDKERRAGLLAVAELLFTYVDLTLLSNSCWFGWHSDERWLELIITCSINTVVLKQQYQNVLDFY